MDKAIIISADDYGMSSAFNRGIMELVRKNIVTNVSVMINKKNVNLSDIKNSRGVSWGLHLELPKNSSFKKVENQVLKFKKKLGRLPSHLDGHRYVHLTETNLPMVTRVAKKYNLPVRSYPEKKRLYLKKNKIMTPTRIIGWHPEKILDLYDKLGSAQRGVSELICHPGYYDKRCRYPYNKTREKELEILKSRRFQRAIREFRVISYCDLHADKESNL